MRRLLIFGLSVILVSGCVPRGIRLGGIPKAAPKVAVSKFQAPKFDVPTPHFNPNGVQAKFPFGEPIPRMGDSMTRFRFHDPLPPDRPGSMNPLTGKAKPGKPEESGGFHVPFDNAANLFRDDDRDRANRRPPIPPIPGHRPPGGVR